MKRVVALCAAGLALAAGAVLATALEFVFLVAPSLHVVAVASSDGLKVHDPLSLVLLSPVIVGMFVVNLVQAGISNWRSIVVSLAFVGGGLLVFLVVLKIFLIKRALYFFVDKYAARSAERINARLDQIQSVARAHPQLEVWRKLTNEVVDVPFARFLLRLMVSRVGALKVAELALRPHSGAAIVQVVLDRVRPSLRPFALAAAVQLGFAIALHFCGAALTTP